MPSTYRLLRLLVLQRLTLFTFNRYPAKLPYMNFHPLEVVSRYRVPQLQVAENYFFCYLSTNIW